MRLGWPAFEKRTGQLIRAELRSSPGQLRLFKRNRGQRGRQVAPWVQRIGLTYLVLAIFASLLTKRSLDLGLAVFTLWMLGSAFRRAQQWFEFFYASTDLPALHLLPLHDDQIFSVQWRKYWQSALWVLPEFLIGYVILWANRSIPFEWFAITAALQAALVFSSGLHLAAWLSFAPLGFIAGLLKSIALALMLVAPILEKSDWFFRFLFLTSPQGWANYVLKAQVSAADFTVLLLLFPIGGILFATVYSWQRLRTHYSLEGIEFDIRVQTAPSHPGDPQEDRDARRLGPTEIEDNIRDGFFLRSLQWENAGWMERWVARFLTAREKIVAEFLVAESPGWSHAFKWSIVLFGIGITAVSALGHISGLAIFFPGCLLLATALPFFQGGSWRGLSLHGLGGAYSACYAFYPISFDEVARVMLKANLARSLPGLPLVLAFILYAGWRTGAPFEVTAIIGVKIFSLLVAIIPLTLLLAISSTTNDTSRRPGASFLILLLAGLLMFPAGLVLFLSSKWTLAFGAFLLILLTSLGLFAFYRRAFRKGRFDLVRLRPD